MISFAPARSWRPVSTAKKVAPVLQTSEAPTLIYLPLNPAAGWFSEGHQEEVIRKDGKGDKLRVDMCQLFGLVSV